MTFSKFLSEGSGASIVKDIIKNEKKIVQKLEDFKKLAKKLEKLGAVKGISDKIDDMIKNLSSIAHELENTVKKVVK